jgi:glycosyltransferase involved in cell wall biosynthesis
MRGLANAMEGWSMKILVATDAWEPQINGVVRTLKSIAAASAKLGVSVDFLTPAGFPSLPMPTYPSLRLALPRPSVIAARIRQANPDAIHVATEGPIGALVRRYCIKNGRPFTTSYTTRFPEYVSARAPIPESWTYAALRRFHAAADFTMVSTPTLMRDLTEQGFKRLRMWTRGVDTVLFDPQRAVALDLPRPIFMCMGRVAVEKNLDAFLSLDLPGSKVVLGDGPQRAELEAKYPDAHFLGAMSGATLAGNLAAADVFVFPSKTDTFGLVQLEALSCGVPVAAFPCMGPKDVIQSPFVGVLDEDLRAACLSATRLKKADCRAFALEHSWERSALQFIGNAKAALNRAQRQPMGTASATLPAIR